MPITSLNTGLSGLQASQQMLDIIGDNLANAGTPGYHRQVGQLVEQTPSQIAGLSVGGGVDVATITRLRSNYLEEALTNQTYQSASTNSQLTSLQQVQGLLTPGTGDLQSLMDAFFNQLDQLSSQPNSVALRQSTLGSATALTDQFNSLSGQLDSIQGNLEQQINQSVGQVNQLSSQIAQLNTQIQASEVQGVTPNDMLDQRDSLINQLAGLVNVQTVDGSFGQTTVLASGVPLVLGGTATNLQYTKDQAGNASVTAAGSSQPLSLTGGSIGGLLQVRNSVLPGYQQQLNTLAQTLMSTLDTVHATGVGLGGSFNFLSGQRSVQNITVPLAKAGTELPVQAGSLFVTVTNQATGQQTLTQVNIDPSTQSLTDVANAINAAGHIQAVANAQSGTLTIMAQSGYTFNFTGQLPTQPQTMAITGTSVPQMGGNYTGSANDVYTFNAVGSGTVGQASNLSLQVYNSANTLIGTLNIGQGYQPGTAIQVANGVTVQLGAGTINNGDSFSTAVVAQPDTSGILAALGLNTFFTGGTAGDMQVNPELLANPQALAASRTGQPGDGSNLLAMVNLSNNSTLANGTQTFDQFYSGIVGDVGTQVQNLTQQQSNQAALTQSLQNQQQSISGVDPNEELIQMIQFQRSFQAAAQYVSTVNDALNDLLQIA